MKPLTGMFSSGWLFYSSRYLFQQTRKNNSGKLRLPVNLSNLQLDYPFVRLKPLPNVKLDTRRHPMKFRSFVFAFVGAVALPAMVQAAPVQVAKDAVLAAAEQTDLLQVTSRSRGGNSGRGGDVGIGNGNRIGSGNTNSGRNSGNVGIFGGNSGDGGRARGRGASGGNSGRGGDVSIGNRNSIGSGNRNSGANSGNVNIGGGNSGNGGNARR
jgi:hypothetical protein